MGYTYNGESDFLKWYKSNYGKDYKEEEGYKRPEDMSDADWNAGQTLYNYYTQGLADSENKKAAIDDVGAYYDTQSKNLLANYKTNVDALDESKRRAQQNASITLAKLKKYLPSELNAQGLAGLGASETASLQAYNNYMNEMGEISANYNTNKTNLTTEKDNDLSELEKYRTDKIGEINTKYGDIERERAEKAGAAALAAYKTAVDDKKLEEKEKNDKELEAKKKWAEHYLQNGDYEKLKELIAANPDNDPELADYLNQANAALEEKATKATLIKDYNVLSNAVEITTDMTTDEIFTFINVKHGDSNELQEKWIDNVLTASSMWGEEYNGVLVDFNYGKAAKDNDRGNIFVFYNGKWYQTNYTRDSKHVTIYQGENKDVDASKIKPNNSNAAAPAAASASVSVPTSVSTSVPSIATNPLANYKLNLM